MIVFFVFFFKVNYFRLKIYVRTTITFQAVSVHTSTYRLLNFGKKLFPCLYRYIMFTKMHIKGSINFTRIHRLSLSKFQHFDISLIIYVSRLVVKNDFYSIILIN